MSYQQQQQQAQYGYADNQQYHQAPVEPLGQPVYYQQPVVTGTPMYSDWGAECNNQNQYHAASATPTGKQDPYVANAAPQPNQGGYLSQSQLQGKFVNQGYKDLWAAVLFLIQLIGCIVWAFVNLSKFHNELKVDSGDLSVKTSFANKMAHYLPAAAGASLGVALVMLLLMRLFPEGYIIIANLMIGALNVGAAIYAFSKHQPYIGGLFVAVGLLQFLWLWLVRRRIPLAGALLRNSVQVVTSHWGTILTSFLSLIVAAVYGVFFAMMVIPTMTDVQNENETVNSSGSEETEVITGREFGLFVLFLFMFYWTTQVLINVVHVTSCGTVATWFFAGPLRMPRNASLASLKRAVTTSFGSICLGSLVVAILKLLYALARGSARNRNSFVACIAVCILGCLERLMEWFNVYAFSHVAIYGSSYMEAARQTWEMIKNCGITAILNDNLVFPVLNLTAAVDSLALGVGFGFLADSVLIGILTFLISFVVHEMIYRTVYSGVVTIFVCFAENPMVLQTTNPQFNDELMRGIEALKEPVC